MLLFTKLSVISNFQFGFLRGMSKESALLHEKEIIFRNIDKKSIVNLSIFLDFSKTF